MFFFFKQKTTNEMRISDWSSDVCSSDLQLNLRSDDVIVATLDAIADVAAAGGIDAIESRLAQNDGIVSDDGALYAGGIAAGVTGGFYVQNSGTGTDYGQRPGLSFGAGGPRVATEYGRGAGGGEVLTYVEICVASVSI